MPPAEACAAAGSRGPRPTLRCDSRLLGRSQDFISVLAADDDSLIPRTRVGLGAPGTVAGRLGAVLQQNSTLVRRWSG